MKIIVEKMDTRQRMIDYVLGEIRMAEKKGDTSGNIKLSLDLTRPEGLNFSLGNTPAGRIIHFNLFSGNLLKAHASADMSSEEDLEAAIASVLGYDLKSGANRQKALKIQKILEDNGIDPSESAAVAQAIGYVFDEEWGTLLDWER